MTSCEAATAPLTDAKRAGQDVVAVMTALHSYGCLTFARACKVLIYIHTHIHTQTHTYKVLIYELD